MALHSSTPTSTVAYGAWRGGLNGAWLNSTLLHSWLELYANPFVRPQVLIKGGDDATCADTNPNNLGRVAYAAVSEGIDPALTYQVRLTLNTGHYATAFSEGNQLKRRKIEFKLEHVVGETSTNVAYKYQTINALWQPSIGTAIPITLQTEMTGQEILDGHFELQFIAGIDPFTGWMSEDMYGVYIERALLEIGLVGAFAPEIKDETQFGSTGVLPADWHKPTLRYRALANSAVMRRHPMMSSSGATMFALSLFDDSPRTIKTFGDYLYFAEGQAPFLIYWTPDADITQIAEGEASALSAGTQAELTTLLLENAAGNWSGVEAYEEARNLVAPKFRVEMNGLDMSAFVQQFGNDSVTFVGPPSLAEFWVDIGSRIDVYAGQLPIMSGVVVRAESTPYVNVRKMTLSLLPATRYYDIDLAENETLYTINSGMPTNEYEYIYNVMQASNFDKRVYLGGGVEMRDLAFWTQAPDAGPGFDLEEAVSTYYNAELGTTYNLIAKVAEANMLGVYDLPSGDLALYPLVPLVDYTLTELLETSLTQLGGSSGTALVRLYCDDGAGNYVADPRLDITHISMDLDEGFAEVEVEAFSNILTADFMLKDATFVQGSEGQTGQQTYLMATIPMDAVDSNDITNSSYAWHASNLPWKFRVLDGGSPKDYFSIRSWWDDTPYAPNSGDAVVKHTRVRRWGFFGNRWIVYAKQLEGTLAEAYEGDSAGLNDAMSQFGITSDTEVVYGIEAGATGTWGTGAEFRFTTKIVDIDSGTLKIEPIIGSFMPEFAPKWLPNVGELINRAKEAKPRKAKRVTNSYVAQMGHSYAVQVPQAVIDLELDAGVHYYDTMMSAGATHLASWLTCREVLGTRRVELRYAGAHYWVVNQFLAIARRPEAGTGAPVVWYDVLLVMEPSRVTGEVNGEVWTSVRCAYVGAYNTITGLEDHEMPLSWGAVWDRRGEGGVM